MGLFPVVHRLHLIQTPNLLVSRPTVPHTNHVHPQTQEGLLTTHLGNPLSWRHCFSSGEAAYSLMDFSFNKR